VYSRGEPVAKPLHGLRRRQKHVVDHYVGKGDIRAVLWSPPVNEFSFGDRESYLQVGTPLLNDAEQVHSRSKSSGTQAGTVTQKGNIGCIIMYRYFRIKSGHRLVIAQVSPSSPLSPS